MLPKVANQLRRAIISKNVARVEQLIASNGLFDKDSWGNSGGFEFLLLALNKGALKIIMLLFNNGCSVVDLSSSVPNKNDVPLHVVMRNNLPNENKMLILDLILKKGVDIDVRNSNGLTPLHVVASRLNFTMCQYLLAQGAYVNSLTTGRHMKGYTAISLAIRNKSFQKVDPIVRFLVEHGANIYNHENMNDEGLSLVHFAVQREFSVTLQFLLEKGADVDPFAREDGCTPLFFAINQNSQTAVKLLLKHGACVNLKNKMGETPLSTAIQKGNKKIIRSILGTGRLDKRAESNIREFYDAVILGHIDVVAELIQFGFTVLRSSSCDPDLLYGAINIGCLSVVRTILQHGYDANSYCTSECRKVYLPLHLATELSHLDTIKLLIKYGAQIDAVDANGDTAFWYAVKKNCVYSALTLIELGAKVNQSRDGIHPIEVACANKNKIMVQILLKHGADINVLDIGNYKTTENWGAENWDEVNSGVAYNMRMTCNRSVCYPNWERGVKQIDLPNDAYYNSHENSLFSILLLHVMKLKNANLFISRKNLKSIEGLVIPEKLKTAMEKCRKETDELKTQCISYSELSFFRFLLKTPQQTAFFLTNNKVLQLSDWNVYNYRFPVYCDVIRHKFNIGMRRLRLLKKLEVIFCEIFQTLSDDCIEHVLEFLSNDDLEVLSKLD